MRSFAVVACLVLGTLIGSTSRAGSLGFKPSSTAGGLDLAAVYGSSFEQWIAADFRLSLGDLGLPAQSHISMAVSPGSVRITLPTLTSQVAGVDVKFSFSDTLRARGLSSLTIDGLGGRGGATFGVLAPIPEPSSVRLYLIAVAGAAIVCGTSAGRRLLGYGTR